MRELSGGNGNILDFYRGFSYYTFVETLADAHLRFAHFVVCTSIVKENLWTVIELGLMICMVKRWGSAQTSAVYLKYI